MKRLNPYACATGVHNTRVKNVDAGTLATLREDHSKPVALSTTAKAYAAMNKADRGDVKKPLPYFVGGTVNGKRHDTNVTARTLLTLDIEATGDQDPPPQPQAVLEALKALGAEGWVYTSVSHTDAAPRYRVVLPLGKPIEGPALSAATLEATTRAAARKLGIEPWCTPESWVLSQAMYLPAKLKGGKHWEAYTEGKAWRTVAAAKSAAEPDERLHRDPVLDGLMKSGLYLHEDRKQRGKHYFRCPFADDHGAVNDTQTCYYEHGSYDKADPLKHGPNDPAGVHCMDTEPDQDGHPHLTLQRLKEWLRAQLGDRYTGHEKLSDFPDLRPGQRKRHERLSAQTVTQFLDYVAPPWLVPDLMARGEGVLVQGQSGAGKSFFALDVALRLACGMPWQDRPVPPDAWVAYIAAEGAASLRKRLLAWLAHHGKPAEQLRILFFPDTLNLADERECVRVCEEVLRATGGRGVDAFVTDTLARATAGLNENSSEMGVPLRNLQGMARATGGTPITVHHLGKDAERGGRGWSGIHADMDTVLEVQGTGKVRTIRVVKQRDGREGDVFAFALNEVGESAVVDYRDAPTRAESSKPLSGERLRIHTVLERLNSGHAIPLSKVLDAYVTAKHADQKEAKQELTKATALRQRCKQYLEQGVGSYCYDPALDLVNDTEATVAT